MNYYVIFFPGTGRFYRSKSLLVCNRECAKKFSSKGYAAKVAKKSPFADMEHRIIEVGREPPINEVFTHLRE